VDSALPWAAPSNRVIALRRAAASSRRASGRTCEETAHATATYRSYRDSARSRRLAWRDGDTSRPACTYQETEIECPSVGSERKTHFTHRRRFFDSGVCPRSGWAVAS
jgi:hypothetical protein